MVIVAVWILLKWMDQTNKRIQLIKTGENMWKPKEIIISESVKDDPITAYFLGQCPGVPVKYVSTGISKGIVEVSDILRNSGSSMLDKILAGKKVVYVSPAGNAVDVFTMPDDRMVCPHFRRLKLASNGCFYHCDWCYLKLTYRVFEFDWIQSCRLTAGKRLIHKQSDKYLIR